MERKDKKERETSGIKTEKVEINHHQQEKCWIFFFYIWLFAYELD